MRQQLEMLIIPFYLPYLLHYLFNLIIFRDHKKAYINIAFEKEAYTMEKHPDYLQQRQLWAWTEFLGSNSSKRF